ncbi:coatomer subunit beta [Glugoides intestinalis]
MPQQLLLEFEKDPANLKNLEKDPEEVLKALIAQQSNGHQAPEAIHAIIRLVMGKDDNKLKRLLYYFFETMNKDDKSFSICQHQIKKDLSSPNEYVRGFALKFISTLENADIVQNLWKDIKENLVNKCAYVRMNALFCISELGLRFDLDVEEDITAAMKRESAAQVLSIGFDMMHKLGMSFDEFLEVEYPQEVLEILVEKVEDSTFLEHVANSKYNTASFIASCKLLSKGINQKQQVDNIIRILESSIDLKQDLLPYLRFINSHSIELLNLIDTYDYDFSSEVIDTTFRNADTSEFLKISEILYNKYNEIDATSEKKKSFKTLLLKKMAHFSSTHCIFVDNLVSDCMQNILQGDPDLIYNSLEFLFVCISKERFRCKIHSFLINAFASLKFGKLIRKVFDVLCENISRENYESLLNKLLDDAKLSEEFKEPNFYLSNQQEVFVGAYISICITSAYRDEWNLKSKVIGTLLKLVEVGNAANIIDSSSKATIITCVRSLLTEKQIEKFEREPKIAFTPVNVLKPVEFTLLVSPIAFKKLHLTDSLGKNQVTVQLSGLGDPLYIEVNCTHSKYEIELDLLVINQTMSYLQDISLDFNFSKNIHMCFPIEPFSLQPSSATTLKAQFSIMDSLTSFVTATATFKYPKKDDYSGKPFVQNLSDIVFDINEFLEGADIDFKEHWKNLEWENLYSITMKKGGQDILQKLVNLVNGHLCDKLESTGFYLGNIACYTIQKALVLMNICISTGENVTVELRVRSKNESLVRSVSGLLSQFLKTQQ